MNGSEIEQSATAVGSLATADYEEPPGSNYQPSFSFENLPLFQPPHVERPAAGGVGLADEASPQRKRRADAPAGGLPRRGKPNLRARAFRRAYYPDVIDKDWNDWRWQTRHRVRKLEQLERMLVLSDDEREALVKGESCSPWASRPIT